MGCHPCPEGAELFWEHQAFVPASGGSEVVIVSYACTLLLGGAESIAPREKPGGLENVICNSPSLELF